MLIDTNQSNWAVTHAPAANTTATISRAAETGRRHVCRGILAVTVGGATVTANQTLNLRDGATGAGTVLATFAMGITATAGATQSLMFSPLDIMGSPGTAMTLEFAAGPGTNGTASVTLIGYTI